jgi:hypothetical protein
LITQFFEEMFSSIECGRANACMQIDGARGPNKKCSVQIQLAHVSKPIALARSDAKLR